MFFQTTGLILEPFMLMPTIYENWPGCHSITFIINEIDLNTKINVQNHIIINCSDNMKIS